MRFKSDSSTPGSASRSACASSYADLRLSVATGSRNGVYYTLGQALSTAWRDALGLRMPPVVTSTDGSITPLIDRTDPLSETREALRHMIEEDIAGMVLVIP